MRPSNPQSHCDDQRHEDVGPSVDSLASHERQKRETVVADLLAHVKDS